MLLSEKLLDTLLQGKKKLSHEAQKRITSFVGSQLTENGEPCLVINYEVTPRFI